MKVLILQCNDCGLELNRSNPLTDEEVPKAKLFSGFAAGPCPNGCRSTFSDLNLNTKIVIDPSSEESEK